MFKKFKLNTLLLMLPLTTLIFCFNSPKNDEEKMQTIMVSVKNTLSYLHYSPKTINDAYSKDVYKLYFEMIDPPKRFFMQSDMNEFAKYETKLDDALSQGDLTFFKLVNGRYTQRLNEIETITNDIFKKPINLDEDETYILDYKTAKNPSNKQEMSNEWKKFIKYFILQEIETINSKEEAQQKKKDSVVAHKLKDTIKVEKLTMEQKKIKATDEAKDYFSSFLKRLRKRKTMDWFSQYMNAYTEVFDPHTNYFSPKDKDEFDTQFKGKVIGIGAIIQEKKGDLYLGALTIGAPAWKSKQLSEGDKILKVKSKPKDEAVNVLGMLSDEAVRLIRGEKGTPVTLTVQKKDGTIKEVTMVREEVAIEDTFAKSIIVNYPNGKKYGLINLPSFNADFDDPTGRNASDDIKNEIIKLKSQNIEGIILDLRFNGGGSLTEVGDIMGLFMNAGPYVQVKDGNGKIQTLKNKNNSPIWTGPLVIMQNELSASASEILAGVMEDYGRAAILGSPQSFGKGTVQQYRSLNRIYDQMLRPDWPALGSVQYTIQKFYRINGGSTQRKGVTPDIMMPTGNEDRETGEQYEDNALPWDSINAATYVKSGDLTPFGPELLKRHDERIAQDPEFQYIMKDIARYNAMKDKRNIVSLNYAQREKENEEDDAIRLARINDRLKREGKPPLKKLDDLPKDYQEPDPYLDETVHIAVDLAHLEKARPAVEPPASK